MCLNSTAIVDFFIVFTVGEHGHDHGHDHGAIGHGVDPVRVRPLDQGRGAIGAVWDRRTHRDPLRRHGDQRSPLDGLTGLRNQFHRDLLNRPRLPLDPHGLRAPIDHLGSRVPIDPHFGPHYNDVGPRKYDRGPHKQLKKNKRKLEKKIRKAIKKHKKKARKIKKKSQKKLLKQARKGRRYYG